MVNMVFRVWFWLIVLTIEGGGISPLSRDLRGTAADHFSPRPVCHGPLLAKKDGVK
tara:strand:+ start:407 stop:574 length:168 start_codon:yes stop_codon:yes gene_type:complete